LAAGVISIVHFVAVICCRCRKSVHWLVTKWHTRIICL